MTSRYCEISIVILSFTIASISALYPTSETCYWQKYTYEREYNEVKCSTKNNCIKITMKANESIIINCNNAAEWSDFLPKNASSIKYEKIQFNKCDLPSNTSLSEIARILGVTGVEKFVFLSTENLNFTFTKHHLDNFKNVKYLVLLHTNMDYMDKDLLADLKNLTELNLSYNKLHLVTECFNHNSQLKKLYLNNNNLKVIEPGTFDQLENLIYLSLCNNHLTELQPEIFDRLKNLKYLNLCSNYLTELQPGIFDQLVTLKALDLNSNHLVNLTDGIFAKLENLEEVALCKNNFTTLPRNLLQTNTKLNKVRLSKSRQNLILPEGFFSNLKELKELMLEKNGLITLPEDLFRNSYSLKTIKLNNNYLHSLPENIFQDLTNLTELELNSNNLQNLSDNIFQSTNQLEILNLSDNNITSISRQLFNGLQSLKELYMEQNHLRTISDNSFGSLESLEIVYLSNNHLTLQSNMRVQEIGWLSPFYNCHSLKELYLANNSISQIFDDWCTEFKLEKIDLSYNNITSIEARNLTFAPDIIVDLTHNNIKHIFLHDVKDIAINQEHNHNVIIIKVDNNPLSCDCDIYDFLRYLEYETPNVQTYFKIEVGHLTCQSPEELKNKSINDLLPQKYSKNLTCTIKNTDSITVCPEECNCILKPSDKTFTFNCSHRNLTKVPNDIKEPNISTIQRFTKSINTDLQLQLDFSNNQLTQMPDLKTMELRSVKKLILSHNNLSQITLNGLSTTIEVLELHNNNLFKIDSEVLDFWDNSSLTHLTLHENPWKCDCNAKRFYDFIHSNLGTIETSKVICHEKNASRLEYNNFCPTTFDITAMICVSVAIALLGLIIGIFGLLYYKYEEQIKIWLFAHGWCLWFVTEDELDKNKLYDAFVSFSHEDDNFVMEELVPKLESGPTPFKLCHHYRDWIAGIWIPDNIVRSVVNSRRTIVVLSPNFLKSIWGKMEFRTAHCQALKDGRARVILILYQDVGPIDNLDPELKAYINMNTYIKWGDPWFWDKLRYALPHQRRLPKTSNVEKKIFETHQFYIQPIENKKDIDSIAFPETPASTTPPADFIKIFMCDKKSEEKSRNLQNLTEIT
nr:PREDICTED: protein toll-like [Linepithema humile]